MRRSTSREKNFTYQDTLVLPGGRPHAERLLATRTACACHEAKVIGSKLVFKGEAAVRLLDQAEDGAVQTADFHLPYSQLMDAWRKQPGQQRRPRPGLYRLHLHARRRGPGGAFKSAWRCKPREFFRRGETLPPLHRPLQYTARRPGDRQSHLPHLPPLRPRRGTRQTAPPRAPGIQFDRPAGGGPGRIWAAAASGRRERPTS